MKNLKHIEYETESNPSLEQLKQALNACIAIHVEFTIQQSLGLNETTKRAWDIGGEALKIINKEHNE